MPKKIMPDRESILRNLFGLFAVLVLPSLAACTVMPGMQMDGGSNQSGVTPVIKEITPQLVRQEKAARAKFVDQQVQALFSAPKPYTIGVNDVISVDLLDPNSTNQSISVRMAPIPNSAADSLVSTGYPVDAKGEIYLPYVGAVKVAGLTERELHDLLVERYKEYIKNPELVARVASYRSKRLYIDGEVKVPGVIPIIDIPMTLPEALSRAGGATTQGNTGAVQISRDGKSYVVNVPQLEAHGIDPSRILLENGDLVRVPPREEGMVFVLGDVTKPSSILPHNGQLTLNEALGLAGGISVLSGDPRQIYVVRDTSAAHPLVFHLDAATPASLAVAEGFELQPKDVVYVDATSLARWNRIVTQILPTAQLVVDSKYLNIIK